MQRVVVMGPPGSGKSTLARHLGAHLGLPVFHLDQAYWRPGWIEAPPQAFAADIARLAGLPAWVIDGNFTDTIAPRFRAADTVIYLDIPAWLSLVRIIGRTVTGYRTIRPDMAQGCPEKFGLAFLLFAANWNRKRRIRNLKLVGSFGGQTIILQGRSAIRRFVQGLPDGTTRTDPP